MAEAEGRSERPGDARGTGGGATAVAEELSRKELKAWGRRLGPVAVAGGVTVALSGPLGAGKSTLIRAACRGAGVSGQIPSPTYTLLRHHVLPGGRRLHHADLYRISEPGDLDDLPWEELLESGEALFVEWAERAGPRLPAGRWEVALGFADDPERRRVRATHRGEAPVLPAPSGG